MLVLDVVNAGGLAAYRFKYPAAASLASYSVSRRAPAMDPNQRSMSHRASSGTSPRVTTSDAARRRFGVRCNEPPNLHITTSNRPFVASTGMAVFCRRHNKRARPVVNIRAAGKKPAIVRNTPGCCNKDHQTNVRRSWGEFGVGYSNCPRSGIRRRRLDCSGQRLPGSRP